MRKVTTPLNIGEGDGAIGVRSARSNPATDRRGGRVLFLP